MIHHFLPRLSAIQPPTAREVMVGLSASWKVIGLVSGLELIVAEEHLDLAAEDAALGVELVGAEHGAALLVGGERAERPRQRERETDPDGILALGAEDCGECQAGRSGGGGHEK